MKPSATSSRLLSLPDELLILIVDFLEPEYRSLLCLANKRLHAIFSAKYNLSGFPKSARERFLECADRDYPHHLRCTSCKTLYRWQDRQWRNYRCPCERHNTQSTQACIRSTSECEVPQLEEHIINLIFRAHDRGPEHGLPLSLFNKSKSIFSVDVTRKVSVKTRFVDGGQLLMAIRWEAAVKTATIKRELELIKSNFCCHYYPFGIVHAVWNPIEKMISEADAKESCMPFKCRYCASDSKFYVRRLRSGRLKMLLDMRLDYGRVGEKEPGTRNHFHNSPHVGLSGDEVSRRDLHALFGPFEGVKVDQGRKAFVWKSSALYESHR